MIHIQCDAARLKRLTETHFDAVRGFLLTRPEPYREKLFQAVKQMRTLPEVPYDDCVQAENTGDWSWLKNLILADVPALRRLAREGKPRMGFPQFAEMYSRHFSKSPNTYLFGEYNAYVLIRGLDFQVCPYCDEEFAEIIDDVGGVARTAQLDHFFPKGEYPGLAMCFFNLIPSGANCNRLKLDNEIGKNPYEEDTRSCTRLYPDIAVGVNMSALQPDDCRIEFHSTPEMEDNLRVLHLETRYEKHRGTALKLLRRVQYYDKIKQSELLRDFYALYPDEMSVSRALQIELPEESDWGRELLTKLKHDILS